MLLGLVYGLTARLVFAIDNTREYIEIMSIAFLFIVPLILGAITVYFGTPDQQQSRNFQIYTPWSTILAFLIINLITGMEALICIVMLFPAFMFSASVGGVVMGMITKFRKPPTKLLSIALFIPFSIGLFESRISGYKSVETIQTTVLIEANNSQIWNEIKSIQDINRDELKWTFSHFIGIPHPVNSELFKGGVGGKRKITWDRGIQFTEHITNWKPGENLDYNIEIDTIPIDALDKHIEVGGKYFDIVSGGYEIKEVSPSKFKVILHTRYELNTHFNFYSKLWADFILNDFQEAILDVAKHRIEKAANI